MLGEFMYHNPTTLYFGSQSLENLDRELPLYGPNVLLVYGGGSIKKNGIYDAVLSYLKKNHKVASCRIQRLKSFGKAPKRPKTARRT